MGTRKRGRRAAKSIIQKRKKRQQRIILAVVGGVLALALVLFLYDRLRPLDVPIPDGLDEKYVGLTQTTSPEGYPQLGEDSAPIEVREYSAFGCPHCADLKESDIDPLLPYIRSGDVKLVYVPVSFIAANAEETARAGVCALRQDRFWEFHDVMFYWQDRVGASERRLKEAASELGLDRDAFDECFNSEATDDLLNQARDEFRNRGLTGTPSVYINNDRLDNPGLLLETVQERVG